MFEQMLSKKSLSIALVVIMALSMFTGITISVHAVDIQEGIPKTIVVGTGTDAAAQTPTLIGFGGKQWAVIGYDGEGIREQENIGTPEYPVYEYTPVSDVGDDTITLLLANGYSFSASQFDSSGASNVYSTSTLKTAMDSAANELNNGEKNLIVAHNLEGGSVTNALFWPISNEQASHEINEEVRKFSTYWWLSSPGSTSNSAAFVNNTGTVNTIGYGVINSFPIRPAYKLNLTSTIFTSASTGGKAGIVGAELSVTEAPRGAVKLTVKDDTNLSLVVSDTTPRMATQGGNVDVAYTSTGTAATNRYVSCIIEQSGDVKYYGKLAMAVPTGGAASIDIPIDMPDGHYTIKMFNEEINEDNYTDFASTPVEVHLTVDSTAPSVSDITPIGTGVDISGNIVITFSEVMNTTLGFVSLDGGRTPLPAGSWSSNDTVYTTSYSGLTRGTNYNVTISGFKDIAGNTMAGNDANTFTTIILPTTANAANNRIILYSTEVYVNEPFTFAASGDRQNVSGEIVGDERYIPLRWDANPSGAFTSEGSYSTTTTLINTGIHTLAVVFQLQRWDGTAWIDSGSTDTSTLSITSLSRATVIVGDDTTGTPKTGDDTPVGLLIALFAFAGIGVAIGIRRAFYKN